MYPRRPHSEKTNTVLPCEWSQIELYRILFNMILWKKNECGNRQIKPFFAFCITCIVQLEFCQAHSIGLYFSYSLSLLVISDWIECSALPVHTHTLLNMICILISQMKLQLMKRTDRDGGGFEGSPRLESCHGGFASPYCKSSLLPIQSGLFSAIACTHRNPTSNDEPTFEIQVRR